MSEIPFAGEDPYGAVGGILSVENSGGTVKQQTPPVDGYALAAFYWSAADATVLPWSDATALAFVRENPTLFPSPQVDSIAPVWVASTSQTSTAASLAEDIKELMQGLEADDPDLSSGDLVSTSGITLAGMEYLAATFPQIMALAPESFEVSAAPVGNDFDPSGTGAFISSTVSTTFPFTQGISDLASAFGAPFSAIGLLVLVGMVGGVGYMVVTIGGRLDPLPQHGGFILVFGGLVGAINWAAALVVIVMVIIVGSGAIIRRFIPT